MGQAAARKVTEIAQVRRRLELDLQELEDRLPAPLRSVEAVRPTLLMDEADTFVKLSEEHRGLLNAGCTRDAAQLVRTVGENHEPRVFSTWCLRPGQPSADYREPSRIAPSW